jgi:tetratricopeptide (TPR) repeat protein
MNEKLEILLEELKINFSPELLSEVMDSLQNIDPRDFDKVILNNQSLFNSQDERFYDALAIQFVQDLNDSPLLYFNTWESLIEVVFSEKTRDYFYNTALEIDANEDATFYINGFIQIREDNYDIALFHFNQINNYVVTYFIAWCYLEMENYENCIKQNLFFLDEYDYHINSISDPAIRDGLKNQYLYLEWNIYNDLGYCFNRIEDYEEAVFYFEKGLSIFDLESNFHLNNKEENGDGFLSEFIIFANNYLLALEKTKSFSECIDVLNFIIDKMPNQGYYKSKKNKFEEKLNNDLLTADIIDQLFKPKNPFKIGEFELSKLMSKEKNLEDMILEQINYGFKVFNKDLEVYEDDIIYGRQYYIQKINGFLDLLLIDRRTNIVYVVELKRNKAGVEVVDQTEKYMDGLKYEIDNEIRGIICLHKPTNDLIELVKQKDNIELFTYSFEFNKID